MAGLKLLASLAVSALLAGRAVGVDNGLAITPAMGWDNWNSFGCSVTASLMEETAQKIVATGLRDAGYHAQYVIMDDCWSNGRNASGALQANLTAFPGGIQPLADKIHALNLGWGMYSSAGVMTCAKYAGSLNHEQIDAQTFASWGVDYLKYDNCFNQGETGTARLSFNRYNAMSVALNATGRAILYNMCNWGEDGPWRWAETIANSWRISGDIDDSFDRADPRCPCSFPGDYLDCLLAGFHCSIMNIINKVAPIADKGYPGAWNDMDALEVGNGGLSDSEEVLHMTMWAAAKSPLILGTDIRSLSASSYTILTHAPILAINQDPLGQSVFQRWRYLVPDTDANGGGEIHMWSGNLTGGDMVVVLLNAGTQERAMNASLADVFLDSGGHNSVSVTYSWDLYDLWANRMPESVASGVLSGNVTMDSQALQPYYFNVTQMTYADGIAKSDPRLMGVKVGTVAPHGRVEAQVPGHSVKAFRMRLASSNQRRGEL